MKVILTAAEELYGLFVDDGSYALSILAWVAIAVLLFPRLPGSSTSHAGALFGGLVVILLESVHRAARK